MILKGEKKVKKYGKGGELSEWDRGNEWTTEATCINAPWAQNQHFTTFWEKETFQWSEDKRIKREKQRKKEMFVQGRARCWNKTGILFIIFSLRFIFILSQEDSTEDRKKEQCRPSMKNCTWLCLSCSLFVLKYYPKHIRLHFHRVIIKYVF